MIPNIIHMIYPVTEKTRPWSIVNTLAVKLARKNFDGTIKVWTNRPDLIPQDVHDVASVTLINLPTEVGGVKIEYPQYIADVLRLDLLHVSGGIYMDTDILLQKPLTEFLSQNKLVMSWETPDRKSISNALMMSPPGNMFIGEWLMHMPSAVQNDTWAYGGVVLPAKMANNPYLQDSFTILENWFCCPLDLSSNWLFDPHLKYAASIKIKDAFAIHVFETFWRDIIKDITPEWLDRNDCLFKELLTDT